jgi:hypothetical protein
VQRLLSEMRGPELTRSPTLLSFRRQRSLDLDDRIRGALLTLPAGQHVAAGERLLFERVNGNSRPEAALGHERMRSFV